LVIHLKYLLIDRNNLPSSLIKTSFNKNYKMKKLIAIAVKAILVGFIITARPVRLFSQNTTNQNIIAPNAKPAVFLQEGVSVPNDESAPSFTPDGNTVYLSDSGKIRFSKKINGKWTRPKTVSVSGHWKDWDAALSPSGKRLVFVSNRPLEGSPQDKPQKNNQLWYSDLISGESWSKPKHMDAPVNLDGFNDYAPSISRAGTLCFCSRGRDGNKGMGAYYAKWLGDHYDKPKLLALNGDKDIFDPFIAPDEHYIIFVSEKNLYISYRHNNEWSAGEKLSTQVNNGGNNGGPYVSPDGKMLYYSSSLTDGILMIAVNIPTK
jgi:Tol biopolymer transport system component